MRPILLQRHLLTAAAAVVATAGWLLLLGGCASDGAKAVKVKPGHLVKVNSTANGTVEKGTSYYVIGARDVVDDSTLLFAEAERLVKGALGAKGLTEAPSLPKAAVVVELEYGMGPARVQNRVTVEGVVPPPDLDRRPDGNEADTARLRSKERGPLEKHMILTAREAHPPGEATPRTLWRVEMSLIDLSNDLRKYLPLLAAVGLDQIGQDSGGSLLVRIDEKDKSVELLKKANRDGNQPEAAGPVPAGATSR